MIDNKITETKICLSIILVTFNSEPHIEECLSSIKGQSSDLNIEVIVVDNASQDRTIDIVAKSFPESIIIRNGMNLGFSRANNLALKIARGDKILFLNPDTVLHNTAIVKALEIMSINPQCGALGANLLDDRGKPERSFARFPSLKNLILTHIFSKRWRYGSLKGSYCLEKVTIAEVDWILGAFLLTEKDLMEQIGGWDENFFLYGEDLDLCYRLKLRGYSILYNSGINILHHGPSPWTDLKYKYVYKALLLFYLKHYTRWKYELLRFFMTLVLTLRLLKSDFKISPNSSKQNASNIQYYREFLKIVWHRNTIDNRVI